MQSEVAVGSSAEMLRGRWIELDPGVVGLSGGWMEIGYEASWFDPCERPVLRCWTGDLILDQPLIGAILGRVQTVVFVPPRAKRIAIRPLREGEWSAFRTVRWRRISGPDVLARAFAQDGWTALESIGARIFGGPEETRQILRAALGGILPTHLKRWRQERYRPLDLAGLDRPRFDWAHGPRLRLVLPASVRGSGVPTQPYPHVSASTAGEDWSDLASRDLLLLVPAGVRLRPEALAVIAEAAMRRPETDVFFGDEIIGTSGEDWLQLRLRSDWSPIDADRLLVGRDLVAVRADAVRRTAVKAALSGEAPIPLGDVLAARSVSRVEHVRRILCQREVDDQAKRTSPSKGRVADGGGNVPRPAAVSSGDASTTVIIPTRNRADLLEACLDGLLGRTRAPASFQVVLVDNGSRQPRVERLYKALERDSRVLVLRRPGAFNFSWLCNEGADVASGDVLVFLNNDVDVIHEDWLAPLIEWAVKPHVGAVGARLLYPDGRVQHDGVIVGIGGFAGHAYHRRPRSAWDADDDAPRRVSAVTGACLAVQKAKFAAVNGFDAAGLPVDLSDVDLCLKLEAAGWGSVIIPAAQLTHRESASRGDALKPFTQYGQERRIFRERWAERIADDPYFHPALSLFSRDVRLG